MTPFSKSIVFITGAFMSNNCWEEWIIYFESKGYSCMAPVWPYKDAPAEELRNRPSSDPIALNTITSLTDHFAVIIKALAEKPILVGHSIGGLVVQLLLQRDLGVAGVAIHSFPPRGVNRFRLSFLKAIWEMMMLLTSNRETYLLSFIKWKYALANGMSCEQQKELYYRYVVPESKRIIRDTFKCSTGIDFKKPHAPLLFTSGSNDKLIPSSLNFSNYNKYADTHSVTNYKDFKDHNHLVFGQPAWRVEAEFVYYWLEELK
jgi:pimeloyl-ACP methyl ester carboxylesterase